MTFILKVKQIPCQGGHDKMKKQHILIIVHDFYKTKNIKEVTSSPLQALLGKANKQQYTNKHAFLKRTMPL